MPGHRMVATGEVAHQIVTAAIGQSEIADQNIEAALRLVVARSGDHLTGFADAARPGHFMAGAFQETRQLLGRIGMILDQQHAQRAGRIGRTVCQRGSLEFIQRHRGRVDGRQANG